MKLIPLGDRVILKQVEVENKTKSGIVLTGQAKENPQEAIVIAVGPGGMVNGVKVDMLVKKGQHVITSKYVGTNVEIDGESYNVVRQDEILAILDK